MNAIIDPEREKLLLERDRLKLERQKLAIEVRLKRAEAKPQPNNFLKEFLANPFTLAIAGGFITLMTTAISNLYTAQQTLSLERLRADNAVASARETLQTDLIKKFVEGPSSNAVRSNLRFLAEAGLIPSYRTQIEGYLSANPDKAPQVTRLEDFLRSDDAFELDKLPSSDPLVGLGQNVGRLIFEGPTPEAALGSCTAFLIGADLILTSGNCVLTGSSFAFDIDGATFSARPTKHKIPQPPARSPDFAMLQLANPVPRRTWLKLSSRPPAAGEKLAMVMFGVGARVRWAVRSPRCRVLSVAQDTFQHLCDTRVGASGAPVLSADTGEVLGIHSGSVLDNSAGFANLAMRADVVANLAK